jgi:hypothetical protein
MTPTRTYGTLEWTPAGWLIERIEPHVVLRLKALFPRIDRTRRPPFVLKGGPLIDADLSWFLSRYPLAMTAADVARLELGKEAFAHEQQQLQAIMRPDWKPGASAGFRDGASPYTFQAQAAEMARRLGRLLIMDDVGLGKTVSALAAIAHPAHLPAAIVVQPHLARQWVDEYIAVFTKLRAHIIRGTKPYELPPADVYIWKYSNMAGWVDFVATAPIRSVVFDEVQELRHGTETAKGRAARAFCGFAEPKPEDSITMLERVASGQLEPPMTDGTPRMRIGLTATPIYNYGSEIFNIVEIIEPGLLGERWQFNNEWCTPHGAHWVVKEPPALGTYLREMNIAIRRTEHDVGKEMPPVNVITHTVPFDEEEAKKDEDLARSLALKVVGGSFTERGQASREFDALMRHTTGVAKATGVAAFVRILLEARQPVLLCGWHRAVYDIWLKELKAFGPVLFTGSESQPQKRRAKDAFISGATNCLIMSLRSGVGLDGLQRRARTVVFGELDWSPQVHKQVIGRLRRPGQTQQVDAIYLIADGGSDPAIVATLGLKGSQSAGIVDPLKPVEAQHSDATRIRQLAELYLAGKSHLASAALAAAPPLSPLLPSEEREAQGVLL